MIAIEETYHQVHTDSHGNRVVGKGMVWNGASSEKHGATGSVLDAGDDELPFSASFQGSLPVVPEAVVTAPTRVAVSTAPVQLNNGHAKTEEEEDVLIDLS